MDLSIEQQRFSKRMNLSTDDGAVVVVGSVSKHRDYVDKGEVECDRHVGVVVTASQLELKSVKQMIDAVLRVQVPGVPIP